MVEVVLNTPCESTLRTNNNSKSRMQTIVSRSQSNVGVKRQQQTVGVKVMAEGKLHVYPNPAQDQLNIELRQLPLSDNAYEIVIENMLGQRIYETQTKQNKLQVNIDLYQPGVYFVKLKTSQGTMIKKVIFE